MKKRRGRNYAVFYFAGKIKIFLYIYDEVFIWEIFKKRATITTVYYSLLTPGLRLRKKAGCVTKKGWKPTWAPFPVAKVSFDPTTSGL